jgi:hypothetical protein
MVSVSHLVATRIEGTPRVTFGSIWRCIIPLGRGLFPGRSTVYTSNMVAICRDSLVVLKLPPSPNKNESEKRGYIDMDVDGGADRYKVLPLIAGKVEARIESGESFVIICSYGGEVICGKNRVFDGRRHYSQSSIELQRWTAPEQASWCLSILVHISQPFSPSPYRPVSPPPSFNLDTFSPRAE